MGIAAQQQNNIQLVIFHIIFQQKFCAIFIHLKKNYLFSNTTKIFYRSSKRKHGWQAVCLFVCLSVCLFICRGGNNRIIFNWFIIIFQPNFCAIFIFYTLKKKKLTFRAIRPRTFIDLLKEDMAFVCLSVCLFVYLSVAAATIE